MSAKVGQISVTGQPTPVIIKVGGDTADTYNVQSNVQSPVTIDSPLMDFHDPHPGPTWKKSTSQKKGRIKELTIKEGNELRDFAITPDDQLASITIQYGLDELIIREVGKPTNDVRLELVSEQIAFTPKTEPDWSDASAMFPQALTAVLFKQGDRVVVEASFPDPIPGLTLNVDFHRT